jgi:hypothetical protein
MVGVFRHGWMFIYVDGLIDGWIGGRIEGGKNGKWTIF